MPPFSLTGNGMRFNKRENKVEFTKNEERSIIRSWFEAMTLRQIHSPGQLRNLYLVQKTILQANSDLKIVVFENFLNVLAELGVDEPKFNKGKAIGWGSYFPIPRKSDGEDAHREALRKRMKNRREAMNLFSDEFPEVTLISDEEVPKRAPKLAVIQGGRR